MQIKVLNIVTCTILILSSEISFSFTKSELEELRKKTNTEIQRNNNTQELVENVAKKIKTEGSHQASELGNSQQKMFNDLNHAKPVIEKQDLISEVKATESVESFATMLDNYKAAAKNDPRMQQAEEELKNIDPKSLNREMLANFKIKNIQGTGVNENKPTSIKEVARLAVATQFKLPNDFVEKKAKEVAAKKTTCEEKKQKVEEIRAKGVKDLEDARDRKRWLQSQKTKGYLWGYYSNISPEAENWLTYHADSVIADALSRSNTPVSEVRIDFKAEEIRAEKEADELMNSLRIFEGKLVKWTGRFRIGQSDASLWFDKPNEVQDNPNLCIFVGGDSQSFLKFGEEEASEYWCCFPSVLAKILHADSNARQRFRPFGNGKHADCSGLSWKEVQAIDFDSVNFHEFEVELMQKFGGLNSDQVKTNFAGKIQKNLQQESSGVYSNMTNKNAVDGLVQQAIEEKNKKHEKGWLESAVDFFTGSK